jgi:glycosyltransferase involved in cell wall biosynthesis
MEGPGVRLLYLCTDFGINPRGVKGASIHLRSITRALCEHGHEVLLASPKGGAGDDHPAHTLHVDPDESAEKNHKALKTWLLDHAFNEAVAREMRPLMLNVTATQSLRSSLLARPVDAIVERLSVLGHVGIDLADALDVPLVVEMNAPLTDEAEAYRSLQLRSLAREIERRVLRRADAVAVVSQELRSRLVDNGAPPQRVHVVPNGADVERFATLPCPGDCRARWGLNGEFVVGFVGSLKPWHGADVLLRALALLRRTDPAARALIVGDGPSADSLRALAQELSLDEAVLFTGALPHAEVAAALGAMDVAAAPYAPVPGFYFSPLKLFEYMAAGRCVVASRLGQITDVIEDGVNGLLCDPADPQDLHERLLQVRSDSALRRNLGTAARDTVRDRYTWRHAAASLTSVIQRAVAARSPTRLPPAEAGL